MFLEQLSMIFCLNTFFTRAFEVSTQCSVGSYFQAYYDSLSLKIVLMNFMCSENTVMMETMKFMYFQLNSSKKKQSFLKNSSSCEKYKASFLWTYFNLISFICFYFQMVLKSMIMNTQKVQKLLQNQLSRQRNRCINCLYIVM